MDKKRSVEEMRIRVDNLKKIYGDLVDALLSIYSTCTSNELDKLYLVYFGVRRIKLRYSTTAYGKQTEIPYEKPKYSSNKNDYYVNILEPTPYSLYGEFYGATYV